MSQSTYRWWARHALPCSILVRGRHNFREAKALTIDAPFKSNLARNTDMLQDIILIRPHDNTKVPLSQTQQNTCTNTNAMLNSCYLHATWRPSRPISLWMLPAFCFSAVAANSWRCRGSNKRFFGAMFRRKDAKSGKKLIDSYKQLIDKYLHNTACAHCKHTTAFTNNSRIYVQS